MRKIYILSFGLMLSLSIYGKQVNSGQALNIAQEVASSKSNLRSSNLQLIYTSYENKTDLRSSSNILYYVYNIGESGFVIVSGDDCFYPVIGYSFESNYNTNSLPPNFQSWMEGIEKSIAEAIKENKPASEKTVQAWKAYLSGKTAALRSSQAVAPLIKTKWGQGEPYNRFCPEINGQKTPTGCVATAAAQIMKYYNYPAKGKGNSEAYTAISGVNIPSINFANTTYNWNVMTNEYSSSSSEESKNTVAELMYHLGASLKMEYDLEGSGSSINAAMKSFVEHFSYDASFQLCRSSYPYYKLVLISSTTQINIFKDEIDAQRPIFCDGSHKVSDIGHAFICDGYDNNGLFHFNWGWDGYDDGYYTLEGTVFNISGIWTWIKPSEVISSENQLGPLTWTLEDSTLIISGKGIIPSWEYIESYPWTSKKNNIKTLKILDGIYGVDGNSFYDYNNLLSVELPNTLEYIRSYAFSYCNLKSITIPSSVIFIDDYAFGGNANLNSINVDNANINYCSDNGILYNKDKTILIQYPAAKSITSFIIPNTVKEIRYGAFRDSRLESVIIPESVTGIGNSAFVGTPMGNSVFGDILKMEVQWKTPLAIAQWEMPTGIQNALFGGRNLSQITLIVPDGTKSKYENAPVWKDFGTIIEKSSSAIFPIPSVVKPYISGNILYLNTPWKETISIYSSVGTLLLSKPKQAGALQIPLNDIPTRILIVKGSLGWSEKMININK